MMNINELLANNNKMEQETLGFFKKTKLPKLIRRIGEDYFGVKSEIYLCLDKNSTVKAKKLLFKNARSVEFEFMYKRGVYPGYVQEYKSETPAVGYVLNDFTSFILCDHEEILLSFFRDLRANVNYRIGKKPDLAIFYAFIYLMNNEKGEAVEVLGDFYKKAKFWSKCLGYVISGILQEDISLIDEGIKKELKQFEKVQAKDFPYYCERATALVKLAQRFGMNPDISDYRINKGMLLHENVDFEDITDLIEIAGFTPQRIYELKNY